MPAQDPIVRVLAHLPRLSTRIVDDTRHDKILSFLRAHVDERCAFAKTKSGDDGGDDARNSDVIRVLFTSRADGGHFDALRECLAHRDYRVRAIALRLVGHVLARRFLSFRDLKRLAGTAFPDYVLRNVASDVGLDRFACVDFLIGVAACPDGVAWLESTGRAPEIILLTLTDPSVYVVEQGCKLYTRLIASTSPTSPLHTQLVQGPVIDYAASGLESANETGSMGDTLAVLEVVWQLVSSISERNVGDMLKASGLVRRTVSLLFAQERMVRDRACEVLEKCVASVGDAEVIALFAHDHGERDASVRTQTPVDYLLDNILIPRITSTLTLAIRPSDFIAGVFLVLRLVMASAIAQSNTDIIADMETFMNYVLTRCVSDETVDGPTLDALEKCAAWVCDVATRDASTELAVLSQTLELAVLLPNPPRPSLLRALARAAVTYRRSYAWRVCDMAFTLLARAKQLDDDVVQALASLLDDMFLPLGVLRPLLSLLAAQTTTLSQSAMTAIRARTADTCPRTRECVARFMGEARIPDVDLVALANDGDAGVRVAVLEVAVAWSTPLHVDAAVRIGINGLRDTEALVRRAAIKLLCTLTSSSGHRVVDALDETGIIQRLVNDNDAVVTVETCALLRSVWTESGNESMTRIGGIQAVLSMLNNPSRLVREAALPLARLVHSSDEVDIVEQFARVDWGAVEASVRPEDKYAEALEFDDASVLGPSGENSGGAMAGGRNENGWDEDDIEPGNFLGCYDC